MNNKSWYAFTVSVLIAMAWFVAMRTGAYAHWRPEYAQASPDVRNWFKSQRAPTTNVPCCDISDGEFAEEDIRYDEKGVGHFWTRWSKHLEWMLVPDDVVISKACEIFCFFVASTWRWCPKMYSIMRMQWRPSGLAFENG